MFIRNDLEEAIKNVFKIEKFSYIGIGKNAFDNGNLLIFDTNRGTIAIEIELYECYYIFEVKEVPKSSEWYREIQPEIPKFLGDYFGMRPEIFCLCVNEEETYLKSEGLIMSFPGKAFDFTEELVLLALEEGN